jgi:hypothetical protein
MRLINADSTLSRLLITLAAVILITPGSMVFDNQIRNRTTALRRWCDCLPGSMSDSGYRFMSKPIRYCYVDLNLVVEFDREEITAYLEGLNVQGEIEVVVEGTFPVTCSDDSFIIDKERSVIVLSVKNSRK